MDPVLRLYSPQLQGWWGDGEAGITNASPGEAVQVYLSTAPASRTLGAGRLCLDSSSLFRVGMPSTIDMAGNATILLPEMAIPGTGTGIEAFYVQALVRGSETRFTNAVRFPHL